MNSFKLIALFKRDMHCCRTGSIAMHEDDLKILPKNFIEIF